ncbi:ABC transporter permease [Nocardioides sp. LHD-245]|uniref:ABC transporter permease n=1 Tax=Nocardioides sp. LHD-245 TaxID=3051387 RepID=UPI0027E0F3DD|nr:ABC transporter permease [Nocardioides sp. LHD-245]
MSLLRPTDVLRLASRGLRGHPLRFLLSAAGIAIGVAAMVAVTGITQTSRVDLEEQLAKLGTNLLTVVPSDDMNGEPTRLPATAVTMVGNISPVTDISGVGELDSVGAYRSPYVPSGQTSSVVVTAVDPSLINTLRARTAQGHWFTAANEDYPTVVLGSAAATRLGVDAPGTRLWLGRQWAVVIGILAPVDLASEIDPMVMLPTPAAHTYFDYDGTTTGLYLRSIESQVHAVSDVIPQTASPQQPGQVAVSRPSDALAAKVTADNALNRLLVALAAIGLLVGGIGVSNTMIIASIERRSEIGMRRALGATRLDIATQFLAESMLMATSGGVLGVIAGYTVTAYYARAQGVSPALPLWVGLTAILITAGVGSIAGLYPAARASRQAPVAALAAL